MSMDPNMVLYYNFQNDLGGTSITNMAAANHDPGFHSVMPGRDLVDSNTNFLPLVAEIPAVQSLVQPRPLSR